MHDLTHDQAEYLKANYCKYGDNKLARALNRDKAWISAALIALDCQRSRIDRDYIHGHPQEQPPPFHDNRQPYIAAPPSPTLAAELLLALAFIIPAIVYLASIGPAPAGDNSAELALCAYGYGIPQSPACPLYLLLGQIIAVVNANHFALLLNILSALTGAAMIWLIARIGYRLFRSLAAALVVAGLLAFTGEIWRASVTTSPLSLALCAGVLCLYYLLIWYETTTDSALIGATLAAVAAVAAHGHFILLAPLFLLFVGIAYRQRRTNGNAIATAMLLAAVAAGVFLYLPLVAWTHPSIQRGQFACCKDFCTYLLAPLSWNSDGVANLRQAIHQICPAILSWTVPLAIVVALLLFTVCTFGITQLWRRRLALAVICLSAIVGAVPLYLFVRPGSLLAMILVFIAIPVTAALARLFFHSRILAFPGTLLLVMFIGCELMANLALCNYHQWDFPRRYADNVQRNLTANALIVPRDKTAAWYLLYHTLVAHPQANIQALNPYGRDQDLAAMLWHWPLEAVLDSVASKYPEQKIYLTNLDIYSHVRCYHIIQNGLVWQAIPITHGRPVLTAATAPLLKLPSNSPALTAGERHLLSHCHLIRAAMALSRRQVDPALQALDQCCDHQAHLFFLYRHHARQLASVRDYAQAMQLYLALAEKRPDAQTYLEMARIENLRGKTSQARHFYEKSLEYNPNSANALLELARTHEIAGRKDQAVQLYRRLIARYPELPAPYRRLARILAVDPAQKQQVKKLLAKAKQLADQQKRTQIKSPRLPQIPKVPTGKHAPWLPQIPQPGPKLPQLPQIPRPKISGGKYPKEHR